MNMSQDYRNFLLSLIILGIGGVICIFGASLAVIIIIYPTVTLVLDGFSLPFLESIPLILGGFLSIVSSFLGFYYFNLFKDKKDILSIELKRLRIFLVISLILFILGLGFTVIDIINAMIVSSKPSVNNSIEIGLGLYVIIIGISIFTFGLIRYFRHSHSLIYKTNNKLDANNHT
ncbi:MAG: hypothetical protein ACTSW1_16135 [Candidatus Hodarchaeales archaeon]